MKPKPKRKMVETGTLSDLASRLAPNPAPTPPGGLDPTLANILTYLVNLEITAASLRAEIETLKAVRDELLARVASQEAKGVEFPPEHLRHLIPTLMSEADRSTNP